MIKSFLFPSKYGERSYSLLLLAMRVVMGLLLMTHGFQKLMGYQAMSVSFPDPLGVGSNASLCLAIFGELFCPIAFIAGFLYRLSMIPMIVTMVVAFLFIHQCSIAEGELAFVYLLSFVLLYIAGPGLYSADAVIGRRLAEKDRTVR